jgi:hypothetical protein
MPLVMSELKKITVRLKIIWDVCAPIWKILRVASQLNKKLACSRIPPMIRMNLLNPFFGCRSSRITILRIIIPKTPPA